MFTAIKVSLSMDAVLKRLDRFKDLRRLQPLVKSSASVLLKVYRKHTPVAKDLNQPTPGKLRAGWESKVEVDDPKQRLLIQISNLDPRAPKVWPILLKGSKRHPIAAVRGKLLAFRLRNGELFVGPHVLHPGTKPAIDAVRLNRDVQSEVIQLRKRVLEALKSEKPVLGT
jgi:hypothetical protein